MRRTGQRRWGRIGAGVTALLVLTGCEPARDAGVQRLAEARLTLHGADGPEPPRAVTLPDRWDRDRRGRAREGSYSVTFALPAAPGALQAVYLPRLDTNASVRVNGARIGDGGSFGEPLARNGNRPLLFPIAEGLLHAGENELEIRLAVDPSAPGVLFPVFVGPESALRPAYERRAFLQITLLQLMAAVAAVLGLLVCGLYLRRDPTGAYRWFALSIGAWILFASETWVRDPPMSTRLWEALANGGLYTGIGTLLLGFHRAMGLRRPGVEAAAGIAAVLAVVSLLAAAPEDVVRARIAWGVVFTGFAAYLVVLVATSPNAKDWLVGPRLLLGGVFGVAVAAHDIGSAMVFGWPLLGTWLVPYTGCVAVAIASWSVLFQFVAALRDSEQLNAELEARVARKHGELATNYERLRQLERHSVLARERQRLMRDMHDGMGGVLVSTLALVESGKGSPDAVADALHDALDDLRLVIDSLAPADGDLLATLGLVRTRLEPRLDRHGLRFEWDVVDLPVLDGFGPEHALQALRIVQEAITNVVKHADARVVSVRTGGEARNGRPGAFVEVADDGRGFSGAPGAGRGLDNMRDRARSLGGALSVDSRGGETRVRLWIPCEDLRDASLR